MLLQSCHYTEKNSIKQKRNYFLYALICFYSAMALGSVSVLLEYLCWLPDGCCTIFIPSNAVITFVPSFTISGTVLTATAIVPVLFCAGLNPPGYYYLSRILLFIFGFFQGADVWHRLLILHENGGISYLVILFLIAWISCIGYLMLRVYATATIGIQLTRAGNGFRPSVYWIKLLENWGALMIWYMLLSSFIK